MKLFELKTLRVFIFLTIFLIFFGCKTSDQYQNERIKRAENAFGKIPDTQTIDEEPLTLSFCVGTALKNNLDLKVFNLKEAVYRERKTANILGMLPELNTSNDFNSRNNYQASTSYNLTNQQDNFTASTSSEKTQNNIKVELLFSVIDFGLSYFNAVQSNDRTLVTEQEKRRAAQNLILDVSKAFFRVAAAQYAIKNTKELMKLSKATEETLKSLAGTQSMSLLRAIDEQRRFLELKEAILEYRRANENACIELKSLMGYYPRGELKVNTSIIENLSVPKLPDPELMDTFALMERPELYQLDMQKHITEVEARKTILMMFPNVRLFVDFNNTSNKFATFQSWWELGARAAYNLLKLPQQIAEYMAVRSEVKQLDQQILALSVGILAQVRIAVENFDETLERYYIADEQYRLYLENVKIAEPQARARKINSVEFTRIKMEAARSAIDRAQALGNCYLAYYRILNSMGIERLDVPTVSKIKDKIQVAMEEILEENSELKSDYVEKYSELNSQLKEYRNKVKKINHDITVLDKKLKTAVDNFKKVDSRYDQLTINQQKTINEKIKKLSLMENNQNNEVKNINNKITEKNRNLDSELELIKKKYLEEKSLLSKQLEAAKKAVITDTDIIEKLNTEKDAVSEGITLNTLKDKLAEYNNKLKEAKEQYSKDLSNYTFTFEQKNKVLKLSLTENQNKLTNLEKQLSKLEKTIKSIEDTPKNEKILKENRRNYASLELDIESVNKNIEGLNDSIESLNDEFVQSKNEAENSFEDKSDYYNVLINDVKDEFEDTKDEYSNITPVYNSKITVAQYNKQILEKQNDIKLKQNMIDEILSSIDKAENNYNSAVSNKNSNYEETIEKLEDQVENKEDTIDDLQNNHDDIADSAKDAVSEINENKIEELQIYNNQISKINEQIADKQSDLADINTVIRHIKMNLKAESLNIKNTKKVVARYNATMKKCNEAIKIYSSKNKEDIPPEMPTQVEAAGNIKYPLIYTENNIPEAVDAMPSSVNPTVNSNLEGNAVESETNPPGVTTGNDSYVRNPQSSEGNLAMQTQLQSGDTAQSNDSLGETGEGSISQEEFQPNRTDNVVLQTQKAGFDNTISDEEFTPDVSDNIDLETQKNAGNNEFQDQELND